MPKPTRAYNYKEAGREARGLRWFDAMRISWLDVKLGARMIHRYPGLTLVAGVAMGVAIALGAGVMGVIALMRDPQIPLDEASASSVSRCGARRRRGDERLGRKRTIVFAPAC